MSVAFEPVPNRECGGCDYCCQHLLIDTPEHQLLPGNLCPNCDAGKGCKIYETRPQVCRTYLCGWRMMDFLDETMRPDLCGVVITAVDNNIPEDYPQLGINALIVKPELALKHASFIGYVVECIDTRRPLFLALSVAAGLRPKCVFVNKLLEPAVQKRDQAAFRAVLNDVMKFLATGPYETIVLKNAPQASA